MPANGFMRPCKIQCTFDYFEGSILECHKKNSEIEQICCLAWNHRIKDYNEIKPFNMHPTLHTWGDMPTYVQSVRRDMPTYVQSVRQGRKQICPKFMFFLLHLYRLWIYLNNMVKLPNFCKLLFFFYFFLFLLLYQTYTFIVPA